MPRGLFLAQVALIAVLGLTACGTTKPPIIEVQKITCPTVDPPAVPDLPDRPDDLRDLEADRYRIEGIWAGHKIEMFAYQMSRDECP